MHAQNIVAIIKGLQEKRINPDGLTKHLRRLIVLHFLNEQSEVSNVQIAGLIGRSDSQVSRIKSSLLAAASWEIKDIDIDRLTISLKKKKEELQRRAMARSDFRLAWDIELDFIDKLAELGYIRKQPNRLVVEDAFSARLEESFRAHGVPTIEEFMRRYKAALAQGGGNGGGDGQGGTDGVGKVLALIGPGNKGEGDKGRP